VKNRFNEYAQLEGGEKAAPLKELFVVIKDKKDLDFKIV
jgi:hypothetical protein